MVLIAHQDCAFYTQRLNISPLQLESQQHEDMAKAVGRVQGLGPHLQVDAFFVRKTYDDMISFESVSL